MALSGEFEHLVIKGKNIYVVEAHHHALAAWAIVRRASAQPPNLITIDHHTDTHEAFLGYAWMEHYEHRTDDEVTLRNQLAAGIDQSFSDETKSEMFIGPALGTVLSCAICGGYLQPTKSVSYDHVKRRRDGGSGHVSNGQMVHPYCNTGYKN